VIRLLLIAAIILVIVLLLRTLFGQRPREPFAPRKPTMLPTDDGAVAAEIDGQELDIDPAVLADIRKLSDSGQKIEAIKLLREATGLGLTEAKRIVDSLDRLKK
jgi:ribosomal protein L7/L12